MHFVVRSKNNMKGKDMISTNKAIAGVVLVTLLNGFVSVNLFKQQNTFYTYRKELATLYLALFYSIFQKRYNDTF